MLLLWSKKIYDTATEFFKHYHNEKSTFDYVIFSVVFFGSISYVQFQFFWTDSRFRIRALRPKRHLY